MLCEYSISARVRAIQTCFGVGRVKTWLCSGVKQVMGYALLPKQVVMGGGNRAR